MEYYRNRIECNNDLFTMALEHIARYRVIYIFFYFLLNYSLHKNKHVINNGLGISQTNTKNIAVDDCL